MSTFSTPSGSFFPFATTQAEKLSASRGLRELSFRVLDGRRGISAESARRISDALGEAVVFDLVWGDNQFDVRYKSDDCYQPFCLSFMGSVLREDAALEPSGMVHLRSALESLCRYYLTAHVGEE